MKVRGCSNECFSIYIQIFVYIINSPILIKGNLDIIKELQTQIDKIDHEIESRIMQRHNLEI